jgi:hypothetical protein
MKAIGLFLGGILVGWLVAMVTVRAAFSTYEAHRPPQVDHVYHYVYPDAKGTWKIREIPSRPAPAEELSDMKRECYGVDVWLAGAIELEREEALKAAQKAHQQASGGVSR